MAEIRFGVIPNIFLDLVPIPDDAIFFMPGRDIADGRVSGIFEGAITGNIFGHPLLERPTVTAG